MRDERTLRVLDTGLRRAAENLALNRSLLECHQEGHSPHTLRFLRFEPSALVGFHQNVDQELLTEVCRAEGIDIQRRITGGGAIYFDPTQIGWELYVDKRFVGSSDMEKIAGRICRAAARGISRLGVDAQFRPRNDIEVDGRKISGTGGAFDGDSIMYQGTLLIDFDVERMLRVLRIPAEKLSDKAIASARDRVANLRELLGELPPLETIQQSLAEAFAETFNVDLAPADSMDGVEQSRFEQALREMDSDEWIYQRNRPAVDSPLLEAVHRAPGGLMRAGVSLDRERGRIGQVWITGDFFTNPRRMLVDLEAALRGIAVVDLERTLHDFFDDYPVEMLMLTRDDFIRVLRLALDSDDAAPANGDNPTHAVG
ncbi:lipoate--protein ligase family protein [Ectothiorhodospira variabilis]|uniref:lipoate--protein ligase family protein n=1 Tax=Ectothiorhodospira variabilis TaxID=505694 RepID=UPI001EFA6FA8|nr:lipoate--protein ligase family protein [Ectothiorhodospira variabilis]MCG5493259.1 lipoate--protein ligase family protein [Ectothiorhodospira variabilis]MCG5502588.1 lipoate--protein ligase family protein [Ectothiorhodospira variabilis]MCG5505646.1 lipoate--protein ligase family protein [Ectothiorhodospira variabilis]